jgi:ABC-type antimicrobial peptide transport system permease subunit
MRLGGESSEWRTIVGVAAETRYRALRDTVPTVYLPLAQFSEVMTFITTLVVRTHGDPVGALSSIRAAVEQTDRGVTVLQTSALSDLVDAQFAGSRLNAILVSLFGAGAALLAGFGLYSLLAAAVKARRRELAIRHAIGATPARLRRLVVVEASGLCALGALFGLAGGVASGRLLGHVVYGVSTNDVQTVVAVVGVLTILAMAACYVPARQATRADVTTLLRD